MRETVTRANVAVGKTLVLGNVPSERSLRAPVLSDVPLLGRLFRSESSTNTPLQKELLIFITPSVLDPP